MKRKTSKVTVLLFCSLIFLVLVACQSTPTFEVNQNLNDSILSTQALSVGQQTPLFHPPSLQAGSGKFGFSTAIETTIDPLTLTESSIAVIGNRIDGKVNIFTNDNVDKEWVFQQQLSMGVSFGKSVAIKNGVIYVGQPTPCNLDGDPCVHGFAFDNASASWVNTFTKFEPQAIDPNAVRLATFGDIVAVSDSMLFVSQFGQENGLVWLTLDGIEIGRIGTSDGNYDLAVDGDTLVIGRTNNLVDIYSLSSGTPSLIQQITGPEVSFGKSVAISGDMLLIGAENDNNGDGAAYLYEFDSNDTTGEPWKLSKPHPSQDVFVGSDGSSNVNFGHSVAISGESLIVADPNIYDSVTGRGKIYIFSKSGNNNQWNYNSPQVITYFDGNNGNFGDTLAIDGTSLLTASEGLNAGIVKGGGTLVEIWNCDASNNDKAVTQLDGALVAKIPDPTPNDEGITCSDLESLTTIEAPNEGIRHLEGLQYAINLSQVNLQGNNISDLTPLASATNLINLYLQDNVYVDGNSESHYISDLTPLANATNLKKLWLRGSNISDLTPLTNMANLWDLDLRQNKGVVNDVTALANKNMRNLYIHYGQLNDLTPLSNMSKLVGLDLVQSDISDADIDSLFSGSTNFPKLKYLNLYNQFPANENLNKISDLSEIGTLDKLESLFIFGNLISDLTPLSSLKNTLETLYLSSNRIIDVTPLSSLNNLIQLDLADNYIDDIDSFENKIDDLEYLRIFKNNLERIEDALTGKNNLSYVSIFDNCIVNASEVAFIGVLEASVNPVINLPPDPYFQPCNNLLSPPALSFSLPTE